MIKSISHKISGTSIQLIWLLLYIIIGQGPLPDLVMCFGANGHIAVEASQNGRCGRSARSPLQEYNELSSPKAPFPKDHCGPCVDISFSTGSLYEEVVLAQNMASQTEAPAFAASPFSLPASVEIATEGLLPLPPPASAFALASLRTVVLLI